MKLPMAAAIAAMTATIWAIAASAQTPADAEKRFMPVELQCPNGDTGNLTLIMKNHSGETVRIRTAFVAGRPMEAHYDFAGKGQAYQNHGHYIPGEARNANGQRAILLGNTVYVDICEGSAEMQQRYRARLSANSEAIRKAAKP